MLSLNYFFWPVLGEGLAFFLILNTGLHIWAALHRIVLTFFIFQIVSAFRKYVK